MFFFLTLFCFVYLFQDCEVCVEKAPQLACGHKESTLSVSDLAESAVLLRKHVSFFFSNDTNETTVA